VTESRTMSSARRNLSSSAEFEAQVIASGNFRHVARGRYTSGKRRGRLCVCKWFKPQYRSYESAFFEHDIEAVDKAQDIIDDFNAECIIDDTIYLNHPEVWRPSKGPHAGKRLLVEPWIPHYERFNSNTGETFGCGYWDEVMQALSHFSYHITGGQMLLCDLQGGIQSQGGRPKQAVLTDPVMMSRSRAYGVTDLGTEGILTFFHNHECNEYCKPHWSLPRHTEQYFKTSGGTTMMEWQGRQLSSYQQRLGGIAEQEEEEEEYMYYSMYYSSSDDDND
jgi:hypothetical protein